DPEQLLTELGLAQVSDAGALEEMVDAAIAANSKSVTDYRNGKAAAAQYLMGQVMRASRGKANPSMVLDMLKQKLANV
ncbi:MAG: Asp-tRNA(Asn)/Glu-tRNA(Gln) amidotransferase GatCAB subunit B, partial [Kiritimatiellia bacterium]